MPSHNCLLEKSVLVLLRFRQFYRKFCSTVFAVNKDLSAVQIDHIFNQCQSYAVALGGVRFICLIELFENF